MENKLSAKLYEQILDNMPVACIDIVVCKNRKILLIKRNNQPEKGNWWIVGGRILKNEKLADAVKRKVKEEVGLYIENARFLYPDEYFSEKSIFGGIGTHSTVFIYLVDAKGEIKLDSTSSEYQWVDKEWFRKNKSELQNYVVRAIENSDVFK